MTESGQEEYQVRWGQGPLKRRRGGLAFGKVIVIED